MCLLKYILDQIYTLVIYHNISLLMFVYANRFENKINQSKFVFSFGFCMFFNKNNLIEFLSEPFEAYIVKSFVLFSV